MEFAALLVGIVTGVFIGVSITYLYLKPKFDKLTGNVKRQIRSYHRQTDAAINKAVDGFSTQTRFVNDRCDTVLTDCISAFGMIRDETVESVKAAVANIAPDSHNTPRKYNVSVQAIRDRAENRMVDDLKQKGTAPVGAK